MSPIELANIMSLSDDLHDKAKSALFAQEAMNHLDKWEKENGEVLLVVHHSDGSGDEIPMQIAGATTAAENIVQELRAHYVFTWNVTYKGMINDMRKIKKIFEDEASADPLYFQKEV